MPIQVVNADITSLQVDAIVNAANPHMTGGGGVDGAIHRAAGPDFTQACRAHPILQTVDCGPDGIHVTRLFTGRALVMPAFDLALRSPIRHIIQTVGPVWNENNPKYCDEKLAEAYHSSFALAMAWGFKRVAVPCLSCGIYEYPLRRAAGIAVQSMKAFPRLDITVAVLEKPLVVETIMRFYEELLAE
jgi:O-acetyl-ADP-ribose deacetylase